MVQDRRQIEELARTTPRHGAAAIPRGGRSLRPGRRSPSTGACRPGYRRWRSRLSLPSRTSRSPMNDLVFRVTAASSTVDLHGHERRDRQAGAHPRIRGVDGRHGGPHRRVARPVRQAESTASSGREQSNLAAVVVCSPLQLRSDSCTTSAVIEARCRAAACTDTRAPPQVVLSRQVWPDQ